MAKGKINVAVENIFPLIKKFLYSDHEIFLRELISNATDATTKLNHLSSIGEIKGDLGDKQIEIKIDSSKKTLHVIDKGIGMTKDEVNKAWGEMDPQCVGFLSFQDVWDWFEHHAHEVHHAAARSRAAR